MDDETGKPEETPAEKAARMLRENADKSGASNDEKGLPLKPGERRPLKGGGRLTIFKLELFLTNL